MGGGGGGGGGGGEWPQKLKVAIPPCNVLNLVGILQVIHIGVW